MATMTSKNNTNELLIFIYRHRWIFIISGILAFAGSAVISLLLPVEYESTAIVYPAATSTVSFSAISNSKSSSMDFGEEEQAQQLIQILKSGPLTTRIISEFQLATHYEIDTASPHFDFSLQQAYKEHISFSRTQYGSIQIAVLDKDPKVAAEIANRIVVLIDTVTNNIIKERTIPAYQINKRKLHQLDKQMDALNAKIDSLAELGVVNKKSRSLLYQSLAMAKSSKLKDKVREQIQANLKYGAKYDALTKLRRFRIEQLTDQESSYNQSESNAHAEFVHKFVVQKAAPADHKAKPHRTVIVLVSTVAVEILVLIVLLIGSRIKEIKKEL